MENSINGNQIIQPSLRNNRGSIFFVLLLLLVVVLAVLAVIYVSFHIYAPLNLATSEPIEFEVAKCQGAKEIAEELKKQNLIRSPFWFKIYVWSKKLSSSLQAGKYSLSPSWNIPLMVDALSGGKVILNEVQVTLPEGLNLPQIREKLIEAGISAAEKLDKEKIDNYQLQYKFLNEAPVQASLEGFLFPDTYRFKKDAPVTEVVKRFLDNFDKKISPAWREEINWQKKTLYQILILASIVQNEVYSEAEMPIIASVFYNRLKIGMPLESDATINFITNKKMRQPLLEDLKIKSPYNTYLNPGLPAGPIGNPGQAAIQAVIYPASSDYYYFLHPLDSPAVFSKTLQEHNANRAKYLK